MTHASGLRPTLGYLAAVSLLTVASHASAEVSNVDPEQQKAPEDIVLRSELLNELDDQGAVRDHNAVLHVGAEGRTLFGQNIPGTRQGLGAQVDGYFALGEDQSTNPKLDPAELVELDTKVSYLYEALDANRIPIIEFIPNYQFTTYPTQNIREIYLKWREQWLGSDVWWCAPVEGLEFGGGIYYDPRHDAHMIKGAVGAREFYQDAPFDLASWQLFNFGNNSYKRYFAGSGQPPPASGGTSHGGLSTMDLGGKLTEPLPWVDMWSYVQADWSYWLMKSDRAYLNKTGRNVGEFVFSIGMEWRPE
jgi:hypothetical protein